MDDVKETCYRKFVAATYTGIKRESYLGTYSAREEARA